MARSKVSLNGPPYETLESVLNYSVSVIDLSDPKLAVVK